MIKAQLIEAILKIMDDAPREILRSMTKVQLERYLEDLYKTYPEERPKTEAE